MSCRWVRLAALLVTFYITLVQCSAALAQEEESVARPTGPTLAPWPEALSGELAGQPQTWFSQPAGQPQTAFFPLRGEGETPAEGPELDLLGSVRKMFVALLLVIALLCVAVWLFKRVTKGAPLFLDQKAGRVVGRIYLNPKAILYLVKIGDRILVIGANPTTISLITEITDSEVVKEFERKQPVPTASGSPFASYIRQFHARFSGAQQAAGEEATLEEHLRDIRDQMEKLKTLIGGSGNEGES